MLHRHTSRHFCFYRNNRTHRQTGHPEPSIPARAFLHSYAPVRDTRAISGSVVCPGIGRKNLLPYIKIWPPRTQLPRFQLLDNLGRFRRDTKRLRLKSHVCTRLHSIWAGRKCNKTGDRGRQKTSSEHVRARSFPKIFLCFQSFARMHTFGNRDALCKAVRKKYRDGREKPLTGRANKGSSGLAYEIPLVQTLD
jgi:hypothetical protein